ncbi:NIPA-like protein [Caerostris extrusa]|uniref:NIPA-like protein n=1 Tax=Caerostris extrusa TaxID=172846 RepID=A0AAV4N1I7_CAEEX|nr:NIPA-like protein [Caerostris extrusa]
MPIDRKSLDVFFQNVTNSDSHEKEEKNFNKRISTYIEGQKWMRKPLSISPAVCSQHGWICINSNLLECETCGAKLCCPELNIEFYDAYKACIEKLLQDLKSNHKAYCPWPLTPAPDCFLQMPTLPKEESFKHFTRRLKSSFQCLSDFPQIQDEIFSLLGLEKHHIKELCKLSEIDSEKIEQYGIKEEQIFITCDSCQRSIWSKVFTLIIPNKNEVTSASQDDKDTSLTEEPSVTPSKRIYEVCDVHKSA